MAYDSDALRQLLAERGPLPVIPNNPTRKHFHPFDAEAYKLRNLIERANCRLKDWRRIATRYDKLARNFAAAIMEFRKELMDRWFIENEGERRTDSHDVYAKRSVVWATYFQVLLVAGDRDVIRRADEARDVTSSLKNVTTRAELNSQGDACRAAIGRFVELARHEV